MRKVITIIAAVVAIGPVVLVLGYGMWLAGTDLGWDKLSITILAVTIWFTAWWWLGKETAK
jgi:hypothetical protein